MRRGDLYPALDLFTLIIYLPAHPTHNATFLSPNLIHAVLMPATNAISKN